MNEVLTKLNLSAIPPQPKSILILSDNRFIYDALTDNINCNIELINDSYVEHIRILSKIDILIVDKILPKFDIQFFKINILINCTNHKILTSEINFPKPIKLVDLIETVSRNKEDNDLFCCINNEWIYNQKLGTFAGINICINFTNKENAVFEKLMNLNGYRANKEYLLREVWNYHQDTESNTVETHLYKLKQKLPDGLFEIKNSSCYLNITELK